MAFAISSGMPPQAGIYTAIATGFVISALGGSMVQIGGPTGAFVVVVYGIIATYGVDGLFMCTMMAGVVLVIMGLTGTGTAVRFIPRPIVLGFTNGIAIVIASTQLKDFFGIMLEGPRPRRFHWPHPRAQQPHRRAVASGRRPWYFSGGADRRVESAGTTRARLHSRVGRGTVVANMMAMPVDTIGSRFGGIPAGLPSITMPHFRPDLILRLLSPTLTVAMLGAIESLMSAMVADRMANTRHNSNVELFAQGVANIVSPLFGGLPATGAIARTATNIRSGAKTPVAGIVHAFTLLVILVVASKLPPPCRWRYSRAS
jgi:SulP family sulfate permease